MNAYTVFKKWRVPGTEVVVVLSDFKKAELLSVSKTMTREQQFVLMSAHVWDSPDTDVDVPLPPGWMPTNIHFKTLVEFDEKLSGYQEDALTEELMLMSSASVSATFRVSGGEVGGAGPGQNGDEVREAPVGNPGTAGAPV